MADDINITPKNNSFLLGQEKAEQVFLQAWKNQNIHHAWILNGPKGIGKATSEIEKEANFQAYLNGLNQDQLDSLKN